MQAAIWPSGADPSFNFGSQKVQMMSMLCGLDFFGGLCMRSGAVTKGPSANFTLVKLPTVQLKGAG